jgi:hypothetical protein
VQHLRVVDDHQISRAQEPRKIGEVGVLELLGLTMQHEQARRIPPIGRMPRNRCFRQLEVEVVEFQAGGR